MQREAPKPITPVCCRLRLDRAPSQRVALPSPPPFFSPFLLLLPLYSSLFCRYKHNVTQESARERERCGAAGDNRANLPSPPRRRQISQIATEGFSADNGAPPSELHQPGLMPPDRCRSRCWPPWWQSRANDALPLQMSVGNDTLCLKRVLLYLPGVDSYYFCRVCVCVRACEVSAREGCSHGNKKSTRLNTQPLLLLYFCPLRSLSLSLSCESRV